MPATRNLFSPGTAGRRRLRAAAAARRRLGPASGGGPLPGRRASPSPRASRFRSTRASASSLRTRASVSGAARPPSKDSRPRTAGRGAAPRAPPATARRSAPPAPTAPSLTPTPPSRPPHATTSPTSRRSRRRVAARPANSLFCARRARASEPLGVDDGREVVIHRPAARLGASAPESPSSPPARTSPCSNPPTPRPSRTSRSECRMPAARVTVPLPTAGGQSAFSFQAPSSSVPKAPPRRRRPCILSA